LVKYTLRPRTYAFSVFAGPYVAAPAGDTTWTASNEQGEHHGSANAQIGALAGVSAGVKLGAGVLFLDARYWQDLGPTKVRIDNTFRTPYTRSMVSFGLGYEIGLMNRYVY
jgi:hypothetical protein